MCGFGTRLRKVTTGLCWTMNSETIDEVSDTSTSAARWAAITCSGSMNRALAPASAR